jgi:thiopurine S-methyltransferase
MDEEFWLTRWEKNDIGFHKAEPHRFVLRFFDSLQVRPGDTFFVPLCGKSQDLVWLRARGLHVVGIELSRMALEAFAIENELRGTWQDGAGMLCYVADGYKLFCGNFFKLTAVHLDGVCGVYDRGALVAMPPEMRACYVRHLAGLLPSGSRMLLISYAYDQIETCGPPFSVPMEEIKILFEEYCQIELLVSEDSLWSHQGLAARGVTQLSEFAVLLRRY